MLSKIITYSVKNKLIISLFILALIGYGSYQVTRLPIDAVPDITNNQVQVITIAPSFGATDIERLITFPIEQANSNISGLHEIRSFSRFGLSLVTIVFNDDIDIYWARQQVAERLQKIQSQIPTGIGTPELSPVTTGLGEIYQYVVRPKKGYESKYDITQLRTIQDWIVRRQLLGVKGVAEVSSFGGKLKQYEVSVDPNQLKSYNITIADVFTALEKNNENTGGSYIEKGSTVLYIRSEGLIENIEDIENIVVKQLSNGLPLQIKDIAKIQIGYAPRFGALCYNDNGEVAGAIVMMLKGENSSEVITNVKERIEQIKKTLPEGVEIEAFLDRTKMVNNAINTVEKNLLEGALIVVFVLVVFLGNFRAGLLVASVIPLAMLFAIIMMNSFGVSGNLMSLGALDFGLIVDGAVIIVEAVMHKLAHSKSINGHLKLNQLEMDTEVKTSASKMMNSAVFGQIIILVVYLPIFSLQGIEGKMFKPMAQTVAFALLGAFVLSLTYIPMMSSIVLNKKLKTKKNLSDKIMHKIEKKYQIFLTKSLRVPKLIITSVIVLFGGALILLSMLGGEFIPALEEGDFAIETRTLTGTNLAVTIQATQKAAGILKNEFEEVEKVVTKIGNSEVPTDPMPMDAADMIVVLKNKKEWKNAKTFNELAEKMGEKLANIPGLAFSFQYPVQMRFNELLSGAKQDVVCKIYGENLDSLARYAQKLGTIIKSVKGAKDIYVEAVTGVPQITIDYNKKAMANYGLATTDVNNIINTAFAGKSSGLVFEGEKRFDLVVRLENTKKSSLEDVKNLLIPTPQGTQIPLYQIANVAIKNGPNQIQREDAKRRIIVGFNVRERDVQSIVNEVQSKVNSQIKFSAGYYPTYGGSFENLNAAKKRLFIAVPISLALIFLLLYFAFHSVKHSLLIYSAIPLSAIGGIFALAVRGMPFSISAGIGFIALFGVAVLNGIVLIAEFNRLKKEGFTNLKKIILIGTRLRIRPVLMTAFVASLGFLPMALSNGAGAEVQRPLATVVIGGLLLATFLTLFVLPSLYILFETKRNKKTKNIITVLVLAVFIISSSKSYAQSKITYQAAIDSALVNSLTLKNEKLKAEYQNKLIKSAYTIAPLQISGEYGQINSAYADTKFALQQAFNFPLVYSKQKNTLKEEWKASVLSVTLNEAELKKNVSQAFYSIIILIEREKLLVKVDSLFEDFLKKYELRFSTGESNELERIAASNQRTQINIQLMQLQQEIEMQLLQFQLLLNTSKRYIPEEKEIKINLKSKPEFASTTEHPYIKLLENQKQISLYQSKTEKAKLWPDITLGYINTSIKGTGANDVFYTSSTRFQSVQLGLGIPLFYGAQKSKISAALINQKILENSYFIGVQNFSNQFKNVINQYNTNAAIVNAYEKKSLFDVEKTNALATQQFISGNINYLEWLLLINQSISLKNEYFNVVDNFNNSAILIQYYLTK